MNSTNRTTKRTDCGASQLPRSESAQHGAPDTGWRRGLAIGAALMFAAVGIAQAASAATPATSGKGAESIVRLSGVVNLNTADVEQLQMLPGVGEKRAAAIIEIRSNKGGFKKVEEIVEVKGVGDALFERLKPHLTLSGKTTATLL
jgi:comEA protein